MHFHYFLSRRLFCDLCALFLAGGVLLAQDTRAPAPNTRAAEAQQRRPSSEKEDNKAKRQHEPDSKVEVGPSRFEQLEKEYKQRLAAQTRKHRDLERRLQKRRFRDPTYFGHKRKPKRRKAGKKRLCKECGIIH